MPSHFKVKEYCPLVFRAFREYWKVHDNSFRVSQFIGLLWKKTNSDDLSLGFTYRTTNTVE
jgi:hypothetical protein